MTAQLLNGKQHSNRLLSHGFIPVAKHSDLDIAKPGLFRVLVSSETASQWLALNLGNRRARPTLVSYILRQIEQQEWAPNHPQPIVFSKAGRLIDGQHRLMAIQQAGLTESNAIWVRVETGAEDSVREYMDTGIPRTLDDRVEVCDDRQMNLLAAQLVACSLIMTSKTGKYGKPTPDDAREFYASHAEAISRVFVIRKRMQGVGQIIVAYAAMEYIERFGMEAEEFYADLFVPAGEVQQAQMLRDYLLRFVNLKGGSSHRREIYGKCIGCMKAHSEGREIKKVLRVQGW